MVNSAISFDHVGESELFRQLERVAAGSLWQIWFNVNVGREIDIILLHKKVGVFVIEVKAKPIEEIKRVSAQEWEWKSQPGHKHPVQQAKEGLDKLVEFLKKKKVYVPWVVPTAAFPIISRASWQKMTAKDSYLSQDYAGRILFSEDFLSEQTLFERLKHIYANPPMGSPSRRPTFDMREADGIVFALNSYARGVENNLAGSTEKASSPDAALHPYQQRIHEFEAMKNMTDENKSALEALRAELSRLSKTVETQTLEKLLGDLSARVESVDQQTSAVSKKSALENQEFTRLLKELGEKVERLGQGTPTRPSHWLWKVAGGTLSVVILTLGIWFAHSQSNPAKQPAPQAAIGTADVRLPAKKPKAPDAGTKPIHVSSAADLEQCGEKTCRFEMRVASGKDLGWALALNSKKNFRSKENVSVLLIKEEFGGEVDLDHFVKKTVRVQGRVTEYEGKKQVKVFNKTQIQVVRK